jgi:type III pantothenate kinase
VNLVIDYGNSSAKVGIFNQHMLTSQHVFPSLEKLKEFIQHFSAENLIISSVTADPKIISEWANANRKFILHHTLPIPIHNRYATPSTLGVDRLAGVCGAEHLFPNENCLVIDAGTCITFDIIDKDRNYLGGSISPGLNMRFQAVNTFTAKLPLVHPVDQQAELIGNSTESCIQSGIMNGILAETDGLIIQYQKKFSDLRVILCGGDTVFFENNLKASIFAIPDLVLSGLNSILIYNVNL